MATSDPSQQAFEAAKKAFRKDLKDDGLYEDILRTDNIDKLYEAIEQLQRIQDNGRRLRRIGKMESILVKLKGFNDAMDTFAQAKPEIMALVWGSVRVLLVLTDNVAKFADAITTAMEDISDALPYFTDVVKTLEKNDKMKDQLALFYGDILQFYTIALKFFNMSKKELMFEAIWPKQKAKIALLVSHIERHTASMRSEMHFHHIREEQELRTKALHHFDEETEFQDRQKFHALRSRVAPPNYDDRLDWLLNRLSEGSVKWLKCESTFLDWLDIYNSAAGLLWLQGIPGAGKTYLVAATIKEVKTRHRTLFAFPSHVHRSSTTARSILQSLLFQLASDDKDVQSILIESDERDLVSSTVKVSGVFKNVLKSAGPTYIVLDGLDEMENDERRILLEQLRELDECSLVKVLVSSRPEDDIGKLLDKKAASILVHKKNSASIQTYVNRRIRKWMANANFVPSAEEKIWHMLAPLAANAAGMFLYARIVLDNAELLSNLDEIEGELRVLPKSLDDVYHRIFARINGLPPALQLKAKRIFNWIACSPVLMTRHEMEQLLDIASTKDTAPTALNNVNFVGICGAAVEVVDETPRFVHFTVNEYIFSQQVADFGNKAEANFSLANSTLKYLCSGIFDENLSDDQLEQYVLEGKYRLHWFAFTQWITLIRSCLEEPGDLAAYRDLLEMLRRIALELRNYQFEGTISLKDAVFQKLESEWPEVSEILCGVVQFRQHNDQTDWNYTNQNQWINKDPSVMSSMWARIYKHFMTLLCGQGGHRKPTCHCETLKRKYGTTIFKCWFPSCSLSRRGFATHEARNLHIKRDNHSRPWKCSKQGCDFATIGFSTRRDAHNHWRNRHRISDPDPTMPAFVRSSDELQILLFELTKADDVDGIQQLAPSIAEHFSVVSPAVLLAATRGSLPIVEVLTDWSSSWPEDIEFYSAVMKGNNPELLLWFLEKMLVSRYETSKHYGWLAGGAVATGSPDMYAAWEDFLLDPDRGLRVAYPCYAGDPDGLLNDGSTSGKWSVDDYGEWYSFHHQSMQEHYKRSVLFSSSAFGAARKSALYETRLIQTWHKLIHNVLGGRTLDRRFLGCALVCLARSSKPSITLGAELLRLGAPIDFPRGAGSNLSESEAEKVERVVQMRPDGERRYRQKTQKGMTPLHNAARQTSEQASLFLRFLLEQGADPEYSWADKKPAREPGVTLMKKWLGETWEEVVERTKGARLEKERQNKLKYGDSSDADEDGNSHDSDGEQSEGENQDVDGNDNELGEAKRSSPEQRAERGTKRRKLD